MKKIFSIIFILALFLFEVKSDKHNYRNAITCLQKKGKWNALLDLMRKHYDEDYVISWCTQFCNKDDCEDLIEDYFDYDDDDD